MAAQKRKKEFRQKFLAFLNVYYLKTHLIKALYSLDSSRPNGRLSQNSKTGSFRELFLPKNDFKTCFAANFPKNIQILEAWKPTEAIKFGLEVFFTCELNVVF